MQNDNKWRMAVVIAVTAFSIYYVMPTLHYFLAVSGKVKATPEEIEALRTRSVPLGLDLLGGVDVLLAVDADQTRMARVEGFAESLLTKFRKESPAIDATVTVTSGPATAQTGGEGGAPQIVVTVNKPEQVKAVDALLAEMKNQGIFSRYEPGTLQAGKPLALAVDPVMLSQDLEATVDSAWKVLQERVNALGVTQPVVVRQGVDRIRVQIPGEKDPQKVVRDIIRPAVLEFKGVHTSPTPGPDGRFEEDSGNYIDVTTGKVLPGRSIPPGYMVAPYKVTSRRQQGVTPADQQSEFRYILVRRRPEMTGKDIKDARVTVGQTSLGAQEIQVALEFNAEGTERFAEVTGQYTYKPLAIVLDGVVYSYPTVIDRITGGNAVITGNFNHEEARSLAMVLKAGALPAELKTLDQRTVEATLGASSIKASVTALAVGSALVAVFMIAYYSTAGVISVLALLINVLLIFVFMRMAGATLTLSGIGGILLTVGMAVDANVLIYERIREELKAGRGNKQAVSVGFSRAFSVIFDANLTTLLSGLTLLQFGEGTVKGFALALNVGILANLFTGLFCTRTLIEFWLNLRGGVAVGRFQWFRDKFYLDFLKLRKVSYVFSIVTLGVLAGYLAVAGPNWGVDFAGGLLSEVRTDKQISSQELQAASNEWRVQKVAASDGATTGSQFIIRMKVDEDQNLASVRQEMTKLLDEALGAGQYQILGSEAVSNEVGKEFTWKALLACFVASILLLIYIAVRFEFAFGVAAVIALIHDILIAFGAFAVLGALGLAGEVTLDVVSALLVILGYSINDTIIIFDRVRENKHLHPGLEMYENINRSICESLNRTIMTVGTVVIVLVVMLLIGGAGLFDFALVLLLGVVMGTYSSVFLAAPILYDLYLRARRKGRDITRPAVSQNVAQARQQS